ncbi:MAG: hypothetical protein J6Y94_08475 [Bacteriovoracaceae bacterium]|nr:hypothetical protein [Bacteriovoracaceae bacterium]
MDLAALFDKISAFSQETHGSSNYDQEEVFVKGQHEKEYAPLKYLVKKCDVAFDCKSLQAEGFVCDSYDLYPLPDFTAWYKQQFSHQLLHAKARDILIYSLPDRKAILEAAEAVNRGFTVFREQHIILNGKNIPVQLGEWLAKIIFGLRQVKSASQRGFDFFLEDRRVEVKVDWGDTSPLKGVKIKKSLVELSDNCIIIYLAQNLMIREICFLDAEFVLRRFADKGHTLFLKDQDLAPYFFSHSDRHFNKVVNSHVLLKYATPRLAVQLAEHF